RKERSRRYKSVQEFVEDLQLFLDLRRIHYARGESRLDRLRRIAGKSPLWVFAIFTILGSIYGIVQLRDTNERLRLESNTHADRLREQLARATAGLRDRVLSELARSN